VNKQEFSVSVGDQTKVIHVLVQYYCCGIFGNWQLVV